ncbi:hypothetical protein D3C85_1166360 [compost metagenome]
MSQRGLQQCLVEAAQVANAIDKAEAALGVEIEQAVSGRQAQIEQCNPLARVARPCLLGSLGQLVVQQQRQAGGERRHADARAGAKQCERVSACAVLWPTATAIEQLAQRGDRVRRRGAHVDEIVHAGAKRSKHRCGFGGDARGQHWQGRPVALQPLMEFARCAGVVAGEIDEDCCRPQQCNSLIERVGVGGQHHHRSLPPECIGQPRDVLAVRRGKEIGLCPDLGKAVAGGIHGVVHRRRISARSPGQPFPMPVPADERARRGRRVVLHRPADKGQAPCHARWVSRDAA